MGGSSFDTSGELGAEVKRRRRTKRPQRFKVVLHNDDYTSMDFVVHVLMVHFHKSEGEATQLMLEVHHKGSAIAGVYPRDVAESKVVEVTEDAVASGMPLKVTAEEE